MEIRRATDDDAEQAAAVLRRSISELCHADHAGDARTISLWLANKTPENVRRWTANQRLFVAADGDTLLGVAALSPAGEITLNYVSPDARFRGVSKALVARLEEEAAALGLATITLTSGHGAKVLRCVRLRRRRHTRLRLRRHAGIPDEEAPRAPTVMGWTRIIGPLVFRIAPRECTRRAARG